MLPIGVVGLGAMGGRMASRILDTGLPLVAHDLVAEKVVPLSQRGASAATDLSHLASQCRVILLSLPSPEIAEQSASTLAGLVSPGTVVVDLGTMTPRTSRELDARFRAAGAFILDAPVTGGESGAASGNLTIFLGGDESAIPAAEQALSVLGTIVYCGPAGSGHAMKVANQMCMGLVNAVMLEAVAYGRALGLDPALMGKAIGGSDGWRAHFSQIAGVVASGKGAGIGIKHGQLGYAIEGASAAGLTLPTCTAARDFCKDAPPTIREANRMSPSYWTELIGSTNG